MKTTVLIVDDEAGIRSALSGVFETKALSSMPSTAVNSACRVVERRTRASCSISGCRAWTGSRRWPGSESGASIAGRHDLRARQHRDRGSRDQAGRLRLRREAAFARETVLVLLVNAFAVPHLARENQALRTHESKAPARSWGRAPDQGAAQRDDRAGRRRRTARVLITGENGTGKELVARASTAAAAVAAARSSR